MNKHMLQNLAALSTAALLCGTLMSCSGTLTDNSSSITASSTTATNSSFNDAANLTTTSAATQTSSRQTTYPTGTRTPPTEYRACYISYFDERIRMRYEAYDWIDLKSKQNAWVYIGTCANGQTIRCMVDDDTKNLYSTWLEFKKGTDGWLNEDTATDFALKSLARQGLSYSEEDIHVTLQALTRAGIDGNEARVLAENEESGRVTLHIRNTEYGKQIVSINFNNCNHHFSPEWIG